MILNGVLEIANLLKQRKKPKRVVIKRSSDSAVQGKEKKPWKP
jgi:hypothetical protein